jgi:hypothetical protein
MLHMRSLVGLLHSYGDWHSFPPAIWRNKEGTPTCSWRLVLGSIPATSEVPNLDEPWTSAENQRFDDPASSLRKLFVVKSLKLPSKYPDLFALVGPGTAFSEFEQNRGKNLIDCPDDAILLIDHQNDSIQWMQPGDIEVGELLNSQWKTGIGNLKPNYPEGFLIAFVDGSVWFVKKDVPRDVISKFFNVEDARKYDRDLELGPYVIEKVPPLSKDDKGQFTFEPADSKP